MKKFLLSLSLFCTVVFAHSQQRDLWFNEVVPDPQSGDEEYIELYNTSTDEISLDCYVIVSYFTGGVYVYNFPTNAKLSGLSYYLLSSDNKVDFKAADGNGNKSYTFSDSDPHFSNWNKIGPGGSVLKYTYSNGTWTAASIPNLGSSNNPFNDLIDNNNISLLIYKINDDSSTTLVNGLFSKSIPVSLTQLNPLNIAPGSTCAAGYSKVPLLFKNQINEQVTEVGPASGVQNGYAKLGNGVCGNWVKTQNKLEFTPSKPNPLIINNTTAVSTLTTSQTILCGTQINFSVTAPASGTQYPVQVLLYIDNNKDGVVDGAVDTYVATYSPNIASGSNAVYSFTNLTALTSDKQYLLVYKTALGCYDKVAVPTAPSITTTQNSYCGSRVTFTVTGGTVPTPLSVQLYYDTNNNGVYDSGVDQPYSSADPIAVNSYGSSVYTFPNVDPTKKTFVVYSASTYCFISAVVPTATTATGSISTAQTYVCSTTATETSSVNVNITGYSGDATDGNVFPLKAILYYDNTSAGTLGVLDANDTKKDSVTFTQINGPQQTFTIPAGDRGQPIIVNYKTAMGCFDKSVALEPSCIVLIGLPVNYASFNAVRKNNTVALTWETASEENNKGFYIQRNTGGDWKDVAFVFSAAANGNSNANLSYAYNDANASKGATQYRILQVDIDGKGRYSEIRSVRGLEQAAKVVVFPNPSTDKINLMFEDAQSVREVTVTDIAGRVVKQYRNVTTNSLSIDNLKDGFYNIQVTDRHTGATVVEKAVMKKR